MATYEQGQYSGQITKQGFGESKAKADGTPGTPYFYLSFVPDAFHDPMQGGDPVACEQFERTIYFYLTDATGEYVARDLRRLGYDRDDLSPLDPEHSEYFSLVGNREKFYCKIETYDGKEREKWSLAMTGTGGITHQKITDKTKRHLDAQFGRFLKAVPKPAKSGMALATNAPQELQEAAIKADDIPF